MIKPFTKAQQRIIAAVPTSWLDPLLSGPKGIGMPPYDCRHIEKLLRGVQDNVKAAVEGLRLSRRSAPKAKRAVRHRAKRKKNTLTTLESIA